eukprot:g23869.t1
MSTWCWIAFIGLHHLLQGAEREVHRHQLEISASGASIVRREAGGAAGDGGDVPLKAETSIDTYYGGDRAACLYQPKYAAQFAGWIQATRPPKEAISTAAPGRCGNQKLMIKKKNRQSAT